jgi:hypothetical protein
MRCRVSLDRPAPPPFGTVLIGNGFIYYTVSWRIRIFNCIEEVPQFFSSIQFNFELDIFNWL